MRFTHFATSPANQANALSSELASYGESESEAGSHPATIFATVHLSSGQGFQLIDHCLNEWTFEYVEIFAREIRLVVMMRFCMWMCIVCGFKLCIWNVGIRRYHSLIDSMPICRSMVGACHWMRNGVQVLNHCIAFSCLDSPKISNEFDAKPIANEIITHILHDVDQ